MITEKDKCAFNQFIDETLALQAFQAMTENGKRVVMIRKIKKTSGILDEMPGVLPQPH